MRLFLDSSAIIEFFKNNRNVIKEIENAEEIYTSTICAYEVWLGEHYISKRKETAVPLRIGKFFDNVATLPLVYEDSVRASKISAELMHEGKKIDDFDVLIATQASAQDAAILTKDVRHFRVLEEIMSITVIPVLER